MTERLILILTQITIFSSVTACIIILIKRIFNWIIPPKIGLLMWAILLVRMLWPIYPESTVSVYNLMPLGRSITYSLSESVLERTGEAAADNPYVLEGYADPAGGERSYTVNDRIFADSGEITTIGEYIADTVNPGKLRSENARSAELFNIIVLSVYALGVAAFTSGFLIRYSYQRKRALKNTIPCTDEKILAIYRDAARVVGLKEKRIPELRHGISSLIVGCQRPVIVFSQEGKESDRELTAILIHELNHAKQRDNLIIFFSSLVSCLFWFNPLIWIVRRMLRNDIELVCDSQTIEKSHMLRSEYAKMIFRDSCGSRPEYAASYFSKGYKDLKKRISMISRNLENKVVPRLISVAICVVIIFICLTNPVVSQNREFADYIDNYSEFTGASRQLMHLANTVSVSDYLSELTTLIKGKLGPEYAEALGDGRLEDFRRAVRRERDIPYGIYEELSRCNTDQVLTAGNCAVINYCVVKLISHERVPTYVDTYEGNFAPEIVSAVKMKQALSVLSYSDRKVLESCYNQGVSGAVEKFSEFYTESMFRLILGRISDDYSRQKFSSFYTLVDLRYADREALAERLGVDEAVLGNAGKLYVIGSGLSAKELNEAEKIFGAAYAGQNEELYYLKGNLEGYTRSMIRLAFGRAGFSVIDFLTDYALYGYAQYDHFTAEGCLVLTENQLNALDMRIVKRGFMLQELYRNIEGTNLWSVMEPDSLSYASVLEYLNQLWYPVLRDHEADGAVYYGITSDATASAVYSLYDLGLLDLDPYAPLDVNSSLTCGQSLYYAYRIVAMAKNVY